MTRAPGARSRLPAVAASALVLGVAVASVDLAVAPERASAASIVVTTKLDVLDAAPCETITLGSLPGPDGLVSLREAVCVANASLGHDTITFAVDGTVLLAGAPDEDGGASGDLDITDSVTIIGNGPENTVISGASNDRIFDVAPPSDITFTLSRLALRDGWAVSSGSNEGGAIALSNKVTATLDAVEISGSHAQFGGAIVNRGDLTITESVITGNASAAHGGGIYAGGTLRLVRSTVASNTASGQGGGIALVTAHGGRIERSVIRGNTVALRPNGSEGLGGGVAAFYSPLDIVNSTITGNVARRDGGGLLVVSGGDPVTLTHTTVAYNSADTGSGGVLQIGEDTVFAENSIIALNGDSGDDNVAGDVFGDAMIGGDPLFVPVAEEGGTATAFFALAEGSPARDAADGATCAAVDQRGVARPQAGGCDYGSVEMREPDTTITSHPSAVDGDTASFTFADSPTGRYECQLDAAPFGACTIPASFSGLVDGSYTFQVRSLEDGDIPDLSPASWTWLVDTTSPDTVISAGPVSSTTSTAAALSFSGTDAGSGVVAYECSLDGAVFATCSSPVALSGLAVGVHSFEVRAVDAAGHRDPTAATVSWTVMPTVTPPGGPPVAAPVAGGMQRPPTGSSPEPGETASDGSDGPEGSGRAPGDTDGADGSREEPGEPVVEPQGPADTPASAAGGGDLALALVIGGFVLLLLLIGGGWLLVRRRR